MGGFFSLLERARDFSNPTPVTKKDDALRIGILGAARTAASVIITPALTHEDVQIYAVASRDKTKGDTFAKVNKVPNVFHGANAYQDLLDDPAIDVVYNPLPNGLHFEWTMKALKAGKHVLLEKPSCSNAEEARQMFTYAQEKGLFLLEAFHPRFHPALARYKEIIQSGELGKIISFSASFRLSQMLEETDMRFNYNLGGGTLMDLGCYTLALTRFALGSDPVSVTQAHADRIPVRRADAPTTTAQGYDLAFFSQFFRSDRKANTSAKTKAKTKADPDLEGGATSTVEFTKVDIRTTAELLFPDDVTARIDADWHKPRWGPFKMIIGMPEAKLTCVLEGGTVTLTNYVFPSVWHSIVVTPKEGAKRKEQVFAFEGKPKTQRFWSTYRHQLEAFVDKVRGREPHAWVTAEESIANMECIDMIYEKTGLGPRPSIPFDFTK